MVNQISGRSYMETLLGVILSKSCLPETELGAYDFFEAPSKQPPSVHNSTEASETTQGVCSFFRYNCNKYCQCHFHSVHYKTFPKRFFLKC